EQAFADLRAQVDLDAEALGDAVAHALGTLADQPEAAAMQVLGEAEPEQVAVARALAILLLQPAPGEALVDAAEKFDVPVALELLESHVCVLPPSLVVAWRRAARPGARCCSGTTRPPEGGPWSGRGVRRTASRPARTDLRTAGWWPAGSAPRPSEYCAL